MQSGPCASMLPLKVHANAATWTVLILAYLDPVGVLADAAGQKFSRQFRQALQEHANEFVAAEYFDRELKIATQDSVDKIIGNAVRVRAGLLSFRSPEPGDAGNW